MFTAEAFTIESVFKPAGYFTNFGKLASDILAILISAAGALAFIFIIVGGIKLVMSSGDPKATESARATLTYSIIGLVVAILAFVIVQVVQAFLGTNIIGSGGSSGGGGGSGGGGSAATCALGSNSVTAGENLGFGYDKFPIGQKIFIWDGGSIRFDLGTTQTGPQLVSFTIPSTATPKGYGGFIENGSNPSVSCGPVTITAAGSADTDSDGFSNTLEAYMGTNPNLACGVNAWPPDFDNSTKVEYGDFIIFLDHYKTVIGDANYGKRYDLTADGKINEDDYNVINISYWNKRCN